MERACSICINETIYDGQAEQGVELDYVLPDYYPEIFKVLKCRLTPRILSYSFAGDSRLVLDGCVDIRVMYMAENSSAIHCIEQHYTYSKTVELNRSIPTEDRSVSVKLTPKPDYCNCRAVSGRRIDVRGAVSTRIRITADTLCKLPSLPESVQVRTEEMMCCSDSISAEKQFSVREEIETGAHGIGSIIRCCALPKINEIRIIADKAVVKGMITVNAAYGVSDPESQGCPSVERMTADIPVSQIIDIDGIDDSFIPAAELDVLSCELTCSSDSGILACNILSVCRISARREGTVSVPTDVFSTEYECDFSSRQIRALQGCSKYEKQLTVRSSAECDSGEISSVWDCSSDIYNLTCTAKEDSLLLSGQICYQVLAASAEGIPCCIEKQESFECDIPCDRISHDSAVSFNVVCTDTDYSIRGDGGIDLTAKLDFVGTLCRSISVSLVENVTLDREKPIEKDNSYALRICYADGTEDCWSIAKRYGASVDAIMAENDIEDKNAQLSGMILIPAV